MYRIIAAALAALFLLAPEAALAGTVAAVRGTVTLAGKPIANVHVTLGGDRHRYRTTTDAHGSFAFPAIPFGHYHLMLMYPGLGMQIRTFALASGQTLRLRIALVRSKLKTIATLHIAAAAQASGTPVSQNVIGKQELKVLPNATNLDRVIETLPGIVRFSYNEPVAHGFHGVTYEIDGAPMPLATSSNFSQIIDPRNVDAIEVFTGSMPAQFGGSRAGAVINIVTDRANDLQKAFSGSFSSSVGTQGRFGASLSTATRLGKSALFLNVNSSQTNRGLDAPTFTPINDNASSTDQFARWIGHIGKRASLSVDLSNQLSQYQIPINIDPNNPNDPVVSVPGTNDVQQEFDRFASANFTQTSVGENAVLQIIPWLRYSHVNYLGDLADDVLATQPDPNGGGLQNLVGLREERRASYIGFGASNDITSRHHEVQFGVDLSREFFNGTQTLAQFGQPNLYTSQGQVGDQVGLYAQDAWNPSRTISFKYGLRYDRSTGYVDGQQFSPRFEVDIAADQRNILHAYYGRFYAAPQLEDVRQACVVLQGCPPNPVYDLKPEHDSYYEIGMRHTFSPLISGYANLWWRNVADVLDTTQLLNTPIFAVYNNTVGQANGVEIRLQGRNAASTNSWFLSGTVSESLAGGISGSTFLFGGAQPTYPLQPEDHDQTYTFNGAFTHRFGQEHKSFYTVQTEFGSGFPVQFQNGMARLPNHLTFDTSLGGRLGGVGSRLGYELALDNLLNHQYVIKIANGFNTTQIAAGRTIRFQLSTRI